MKDEQKTKAQLIRELQAVRQSGELYRRFFESANDALVTFTLEGTVTSVNRGLEVMLGWSREELIGQHYRKFVAPASVVLGEERTRRFLAGEHLPSIFEAEMLRKDGKAVPVEVRTRPIRDADGRIIGIQGIYRDITARKQAEAALREKDLRLRTMLSSMPVSLWAVDRNGTFTFVQGRDSDPLGNSYGNLVGQSVFEVYRDAPQLLENMRRALAGKPLLQTIEVGGVMFEIHHTLLRDQQGAIDGVIGVSIDVTERKRMEEALRASEERYRNLFENANDAIAIVGLDRTIVSINRAMEHLLGWSYEELIGQKDHKVLTPAGIALSEERERRIRQGKKVPSIFEHEFVRKDGSTVLVEGRTRFIRDKAGKPIGFQGIYRDISARREAEKALRESKEKFAAQYRGIPVPTYTWQQRGEDFVLIDYNDAALTFTDGGIVNFLGKSAREMYKDQPEILEKFARCFVGRSTIKEEGFYQLKSTGESKYLALNYVFVPPDLVMIHTEDITERKQAEEALRQAEQKYRMLVDSTYDGVFIIQGGTVQFCNAAFASMVGYTVHEVTGMDFRALIEPEDRELVADRYRRRQAGEDIPRSYEFRMLHKDQSTRVTVEMNVTLISYQGALASMGTVRDITARKRAEKALQKSEQRYRTVSELISDYAYAVKIEPDWTYVIEWFTKTFTRVTGFTLEKGPHAPGTWQILIHPADLSIALERIQKLMSGQANVSEFRIITKNKESRWVQEYGRPVWDEAQGRVTHLYIAGRDVTERKLMEESLRNSEQRYRGLVESQQDLIIRVDPQGHLTFVNDAYCKKFAKQREELIGTSFMPLVHEDDRAAALEAMKRLEALPYRVSLEQRALTAEGWRWFAWEDYAIRDEQGRTLEIQAVGRDITDRKQAEAEKQQLQEQLFQARKLEALGTLAGGVAHDFNNILSAIMGFTELAADDVPAETVAHRNLQEVLKASRRAKTLVQQVLTFSRPYDRQHVAPAQLPPIIEEVVTFLRASLPLNVELRQHIDLTAGRVTIRQGHLHQMLINLCQNAVQSLDNTDGHIEVGLQQIEVGKDTLSLPKNLTPGPYLHLTVQDTGCGMPPEIQERIFEPFFTTRPVGEGNGLGLAIVHGIVMGYGGAITVESVVGQGSTFHIYLPVAENAREAKAPQLTSASPVEAPVVKEGATDYDTHLSH